jgi:excinuclease UvrABC nuclease subunit
MKWPDEQWKLACDGWEYLYMQDRCNDTVPEIPGIYCFVDSDPVTNKCEVVYVGKSTNFASRLKYPHTIESRTRNCFLLCFIQPSEEIDLLEIDFIKRYRPKFNKHHNG